jgi:thiamine-phosphate pyrophosphorylase
LTPVLCLITDRRLCGPDGTDALIARVAAAAREGIHLVQVRERDLDGGPLMRLVSGCVEAVRATRTRVLVNDRLDVALAAGAHGVHLRGDSFDAPRVRSLAPPGFLIGRSVHSASEAVVAAHQGGLDYLIFGTVFTTPSKPGVDPAGIAGLSAVARATCLPVLAVGGMTWDKVGLVMGAGACGVAAITMFNRPSARFVKSGN